MKTQGLIAAPPTGFRTDGDIRLPLAPVAEEILAGIEMPKAC